MFDSDIGHFFGEDVPRQIITYIYENLPDSGIESGDASKGKADDWRDAKHGVFNAFLQKPFLDAALEEHTKLEGAIDNLEPGIGKWGFIYYPNACVDKEAAKKCKFMIVSHGAGGIAEDFSKTFGVFAPTHEVIMLFPQAIGAWDEG